MGNLAYRVEVHPNHQGPGFIVLVFEGQDEHPVRDEATGRLKAFDTPGEAESAGNALAKQLRWG